MIHFRGAIHTGKISASSQQAGQRSGMVNPSSILRVSAPARVCLFGEHQDYLLLPVVACAISLRIVVEGTGRADARVHIALPDIASEESFSLEGDLPYVRQRDYFRSVVNVLRRKGWTFSRGCECRVWGDIPISAGASGSSALTVSWVNFITQMSDQGKRLTSDELARIAFEAEVLEFSEHGGMMDHYSTAHGGILAIDFLPEFKATTINIDLGTFVLGDSREPKDTQSVLARVKRAVFAASHRVTALHSEFSLDTATADVIQRYGRELDAQDECVLMATLRNRDITREARQLLCTPALDRRRLGTLLTEHHFVLRDSLGISTPKIEGMIEAALGAGAYGAKINGSGGGGCMVGYAPENPERVARAIEDVGGKAYIVHADTGTRTEVSEGVS